jgi:hypothetical protein
MRQKDMTAHAKASFEFSAGDRFYVHFQKREELWHSMKNDRDRMEMNTPTSPEPSFFWLHSLSSLLIAFQVDILCAGHYRDCAWNGTTC